MDDRSQGDARGQRHGSQWLGGMILCIMADTDDIVLEHLCHIRGAIDDVRDEIREIKHRVGNLENQYPNMSNRLDRMDVRIERIERRLDLTDA